jgi:hypothetical protein
MKTFEIKQTEIQNNPTETKLTYIDLCQAVLNHMPQQGFTPEEMAARMDVLKKLKSAKVGDTVELENAEAAKLLECTQAMRWAVLHEDLIGFTEAVKELS